MNRIIIIGALLFQISLAYSSHENEQVWRVLANDEKKPVVNVLVEKFDLDVWAVQSTHMDILITDKVAPIIRMELQREDISHEIMIKDIQEIIDSQKDIRNKRKKAEREDNGINLEEYHTLKEIHDYMDVLANEHDYISVETLGKSIKKRDIKLIKFSVNSNNKNAIWIQCGIHAREWISPATCLYGMHYIESQKDHDSELSELLKNNDVYMVPVVNPDGYEFSWKKNRLWRKNRRVSKNSKCIGVDLNRNYDSNFGGVGASSNPCAQTYHGMGPFSEPETSILANKALLIQKKQTIRTYYDLHAYGQYWLMPYGWTKTPPSNYDDLYEVAGEAVNALESVYGTKYTYGSISEVLYAASGGSVDWAHSIDIEYPYTPELRDTGRYGFLLPEDQIYETAFEFWTGFMAAYQQQRLQ